MKLSQITTVKGRLDDVKLNIGRWLNNPHLDELIIVDWACPQNTGQYVRDNYKKDPRVKVVFISPEDAGPFFNLGAARNLGARRAKNQHLFFLDADCYANQLFYDKLDLYSDASIGNPDAPDSLGDMLDLLVTGTHCISETTSTSSLLDTWTIDGQCIIRSHLLHSINGYVEGFGWGGESYDLYLRAVRFGNSRCNSRCRIGFFPEGGIVHRPHSDELRHQYYPVGWETTIDRDDRHVKRSRLLKIRRDRSFRAQPGRPFGTINDDLVCREAFGSTDRVVTPLCDF